MAASVMLHVVNQSERISNRPLLRSVACWEAWYFSETDDILFFQTPVRVYRDFTKKKTWCLCGLPLSKNPSQEIDAACRQLIIDHHAWMNSFSDSGTLPCIFGDILKLIPESAQLTTGSFSEKRQRVEGVHLKGEQFCHAHNKYCNALQPTEADVDLSGLPCPDNSRANRKRKFQEGPTGPVYIAWAKRHKQLQTKLIIIENVRDTCMCLVCLYWVLLGGHDSEVFLFLVFFCVRL